MFVSGSYTSFESPTEAPLIVTAEEVGGRVRRRRNRKMMEIGIVEWKRMMKSVST